MAPSSVSTSSGILSPGTAKTVSPLAFRGLRLNATGWLAVLAPGAVAGLAVTVASGRRRVRPVRVAVGMGAGALGGAILVRAVDEVRWRRRDICMQLEEPDAALDLMQAVRAKGVRVDMVRATDGVGAASRGYALRYRAKDDRRVRAVLALQRT